MENNIELIENHYKLLENYKDAFQEEEIEKIITDYFKDYDYILGDWSYGKLRLKGFCKPKNYLFNKINDFKKVHTYIKDSCAYGCKYFILEKVKK